MAKLKRLDFEAWQYRIPDKALLMESQKLVEIDNLLLEAAERLAGITEFTTYAYTSQYEKMDEAVRIYDTLIHLQEGINNELQEIDNDFFLRLANGTDRKHQGPMEALSSIHMEDISIPNQAGITRQWVYYNTSNQRCLGEAEKKEELTFQDFLCYSKDTEYETVYNPIFQEIFQEQYELSGLTQDYTYIEYMDGLLKAGEFNHEMYKPVQEFLSAGLDIITFGAKPLIEAFVGEDLITGEQMTETERYLRAIEGIVGLVSFGSIWSKLGKIGIEGVTAELAIEVMSDTSSTITSTSMNKLGANGIVSTVAGIIAGGITGSSINNAINTRVWSSHIETPEVPETPFQIQRETIQVEELPNRIDIDTRNNLSQLDGLEENQVGKRIMESYDNLDEIEELYKNIMDEQRMVDMEYDDFLNEIRELSVEEVRVGSEGGTVTIKYNEVKTFTAEETNQWFVDNVKPDYKPPYKPGTIVKEVELMEKTTFVRVYDNMPGGSGMYGSWVMKAEDIEGLTPLEIQNKFALPNTPKYVCDVELEAGTHIRVGEVNSLEGWGSGGGTQYDLIGQRIGNFVNERLLEEN